RAGCSAARSAAAPPAAAAGPSLTSLARARTGAPRRSPRHGSPMLAEGEGPAGVDGRLGGAPGAVEVPLRLGELALERRYRRRHAVERLQLEGVDLVHRRVDVRERRLELVEPDGGRRRLLVHAPR